MILNCAFFLEGSVPLFNALLGVHISGSKLIFQMLSHHVIPNASMITSTRSLHYELIEHGGGMMGYDFTCSRLECTLDILLRLPPCPDGTSFSSLSPHLQIMCSYQLLPIFEANTKGEYSSLLRDLERNDCCGSLCDSHYEKASLILWTIQFSLWDTSSLKKSQWKLIESGTVQGCKHVVPHILP